MAMQTMAVPFMGSAAAASGDLDQEHHQHQLDQYLADWAASAPNAVAVHAGLGMSMSMGMGAGATAGAPAGPAAGSAAGVGMTLNAGIDPSGMPATLPTAASLGVLMHPGLSQMSGFAVEDAVGGGGGGGGGASSVPSPTASLPSAAQPGSAVASRTGSPASGDSLATSLAPPLPFPSTMDQLAAAITSHATPLHPAAQHAMTSLPMMAAHPGMGYLGMATTAPMTQGSTAAAGATTTTAGISAAPLLATDPATSWLFEPMHPSAMSTMAPAHVAAASSASATTAGMMMHPMAHLPMPGMLLDGPLAALPGLTASQAALPLRHPTAHTPPAAAPAHPGPMARALVPTTTEASVISKGAPLLPEDMASPLMLQRQHTLTPHQHMALSVPVSTPASRPGSAPQPGVSVAASAAQASGHRAAVAAARAASQSPSPSSSVTARPLKRRVVDVAPASPPSRSAAVARQRQLSHTADGRPPLQAPGRGFGQAAPAAEAASAVPATPAAAAANAGCRRDPRASPSSGFQSVSASPLSATGSLDDSTAASATAKAAVAVKTAGSDDAGESDADADADVPLTRGAKQQRKKAHNAIERRYRNNINHRIAELKSVVPALNGKHSARKPHFDANDDLYFEDEDDAHDGSATGGGGDGGSGGNGSGSGDPADASPARKLNKATILRKSTEYIVYLRNANQAMKHENELLRGLLVRLGGVDVLRAYDNAVLAQLSEARSVAATSQTSKMTSGVGAMLQHEVMDAEVDARKKAASTITAAAATLMPSVAILPSAPAFNAAAAAAAAANAMSAMHGALSDSSSLGSPPSLDPASSVTPEAVASLPQPTPALSAASMHGGFLHAGPFHSPLSDTPVIGRPFLSHGLAMAGHSGDLMMAPPSAFSPFHLVPQMPFNRRMAVVAGFAFAGSSLLPSAPIPSPPHLVGWLRGAVQTAAATMMPLATGSAPWVNGSSHFAADDDRAAFATVRRTGLVACGAVALLVAAGLVCADAKPRSALTRVTRSALVTAREGFHVALAVGTALALCAGGHAGQAWLDRRRRAMRSLMIHATTLEAADAVASTASTSAMPPAASLSAPSPASSPASASAPPAVADPWRARMPGARPPSPAVRCAAAWALQHMAAEPADLLLAARVWVHLAHRTESPIGAWLARRKALSLIDGWREMHLDVAAATGAPMAPASFALLRLAGAPADALFDVLAQTDLVPAATVAQPAAWIDPLARAYLLHELHTLLTGPMMMTVLDDAFDQRDEMEMEHTQRALGEASQLLMAIRADLLSRPHTTSQEDLLVLNAALRCYSDRIHGVTPSVSAAFLMPLLAPTSTSASAPTPMPGYATTTAADLAPEASTRPAMLQQLLNLAYQQIQAGQLPVLGNSRLLALIYSLAALPAAHRGSGSAPSAYGAAAATVSGSGALHTDSAMGFRRQVVLRELVRRIPCRSSHQLGMLALLS